MKNSEIKYIKSTKQMHKAMIALLQKKQFSEVSVTELCHQANINRSTFYSHYKNTFELFIDIINHIRSELITYYKSKNLFIQNNDITNISIEGNNTYINTKLLLPFLEFTKENKEFFYIYSNNLHYFNEDYIIERYKDTLFYSNLNNNDHYYNVYTNYKFIFYYYGIMAIVNKWLKTGCKENPKTICDIIIKSIR